MRLRIILLLLLCSYFPQGAIAAESGFEGKWYVNLSGGGNWAEDLESPSVSFDFKPGYRVSVAPGLQYGKYLAFELELGFLWNDVDQQRSAAGVIDVQGEFLRAPFLFNLIGRYPMGKFIPYAGVGVGGIYEDLQLRGTGAISPKSRTDGAFQGLLGLEYTISDRCAVGASYKYLRAIIKDDDWIIFGPAIEKPDDHGNHSILATFRYSF
jgi:opacity protein-like surface antigen